MTARMGQPEWAHHNKTDKTGQAKWDRQNMTARMGRQNGTGKTVQAE